MMNSVSTGTWMKALLALSCLVAFPALAEDRFDLDEVYDISPDGTIALSTSDANVTIVGSDRDDVHVEIHWLRELRGVGVVRGDFHVEVRESGGNLSIRESPHDRSVMAVGMLNTTYDVLIEAPSTVSLKLQGDDDSYDVSRIHGAISVESDDAGIRLRDCGGDDFDLAFGDGELDMDGGTGSLRLRFDDGDADVRDVSFDRVRVKANDGTLKLRGDLAPDGRYQFEHDDGRMSLDVGDGGGEFIFSQGDGTLSVKGGSGSAELRYDDGRASLIGSRFQRLRVRANDGDLDFDGSVPAGADYRIQLDDGDVRFNARDGGGRIVTHFDDGRVRAGDGVRQLSEEEHRVTHAWGDGDAEVDIDVQDGKVRLLAP